MSKFGWCSDGHHHNCPGEIVTFYMDEKGLPVVTGTRRCDCPHHQDDQ